MMQKRSILSLMLISFMVVFATSLSFANVVTVEMKNSLKGDNGSLDVTVDVSSDSVTAIEVVLEVDAPGDGYFTALSIAFKPGFTTLSDRQVTVISHNDGTPDTIRFAALRLTAEPALGSGPTIVAQIDFTTNESCGDVIALDGGTFDAGLAGLVSTQFVDAATTSIVAASVTSGSVTIVNTAPTLAAIADATLGWGNLHVAAAVGTDPDPTDVLAYAKVSGPAALNVDANTGAIQWLTTGTDVGSHAVEVSVTDNCGASASVTYNICVTNEAPVFAPVADQSIKAGAALVLIAGATDPDGGPFALSYSATTDHPAGVTIDALTGELNIATSVDPAHTGTFTIEVWVSDSANVDAPCAPSNSFHIIIIFDVFYNAVTIENVQGQALGALANVSIDITDPAFVQTEIAGFDFRLQYDAAGLAFQTATDGAFMTNCSWEYFTYRLDDPGNLHLIALSDQNDGVVSATCYESAGAGATELTRITFLTAGDPGVSGAAFPIRFRWVDCGDNSLSNIDGETHMISRWVSDLNGGSFVRIDPSGDGTFPTLFGAQASCDAFDNARCVDFFNGGITMKDSRGTGNRGDINVNGLANEVGDAVMFTNFFVVGLSAFGSHVDESVAASDVNADGIVLSVSDLVYLIRVVVGDAPAIPKVGAIVANYTYGDDVMSINDITLGGAYVVVAGEANPTLLDGAKDMDLAFGYDAEKNQTNILVTIPMDKNVTGFTGDFLQVSGNLVSAEFATLEAASVTPTLVPKHFELGQNYPNPFNPSTTISLSLPSAGAWSLTIYNISGQVVKTFEGEAENAGFVDVVWDADVASGVYFYRSLFGNNSATKKAVLLK